MVKGFFLLSFNNLEQFDRYYTIFEVIQCQGRFLGAFDLRLKNTLNIDNGYNICIVVKV